VHAQGALLAFEGEQVEPAYNTFSEWLSGDHDRKGAQLGSVTYSNGAVCFVNLQAGAVCNGPLANRLGSCWCSFTTGQSPQKDLYDDLLNLPNSAKSITEGDFVTFVSSLGIPERKR
jgi:hypothetical protein